MSAACTVPRIFSTNPPTPPALLLLLELVMLLLLLLVLELVKLLLLELVMLLLLAPVLEWELELGTCSENTPILEKKPLGRLSLLSAPVKHPPP